MSIYDNERFFENYMERRHREMSPNNLIELPIIMELIDPIEEGTVLDIGCGDGAFKFDLEKKGYLHYTGIDPSENMIARAKEKLTEEDKLIQIDMESFQYPYAKYHLITSRLVMHYSSKPQILFEKIYQALKPQGIFLFSVQHPVYTANIENHQSKEAIEVKRYFENGSRYEDWMGQEVKKYHRTIEDYFQYAIDAGFKVEMIKEGKPKPILFDDDLDLKRRQQIPLFLILKLRK